MKEVLFWDTCNIDHGLYGKIYIFVFNRFRRNGLEDQLETANNVVRASESNSDAQVLLFTDRHHDKLLVSS